MVDDLHSFLHAVTHAGSSLLLPFISTRQTRQAPIIRESVDVAERWNVDPFCCATCRMVSSHAHRRRGR